MRVGIGYDVHRFKEGRPLVIGGVRIDHPAGLEGHSDADVLIHAIMDALLGGVCRGDIGRHFPPGDPAYRDISSVELLKKTMDMVKDEGFRVVNIDSVVVCEEPRLSGVIPEMIEVISRITGCRNINIKATTEEGLGFTGRKEGISAWAVVLLEEDRE